MRAPQDEGKEVTLAEVQNVVDLFPVKLTVKNPKWMSNYSLHSRVVDQYGDNERVFLVGDAAHIHSPVGGQGMNTGMQDSYNLGWKLHMAIKGQASQTLLKVSLSSNGFIPPLPDSSPPHPGILTSRALLPSAISSPDLQ